MSEQRLYEVEITFRAYAYAESPDAAVEAVHHGWGEFMLSPDDADMVASPTGHVDFDWRDAFPFGDDESRTCAEIVQAEREARDAAELAATPDPNQLTLPIDVLANQYQRAVDAALQERDLRQEAPE